MAGGSIVGEEGMAAFDGDREPCGGAKSKKLSGRNGGGLILFITSSMAQNATVCGFVYHDAEKKRSGTITFQYKLKKQVNYTRC